jgi:hypothetical protein
MAKRKVCRHKWEKKMEMIDVTYSICSKCDLKSRIENKRTKQVWYYDIAPIKKGK